MIIKKYLQSYVINGTSLFITSQILDGFVIRKDLTVFLIAALALTVSENIVKPILKVISIPINLLTMGLFNVVINVGLLYAIVSIVKGLKIEEGVLNLNFLDKIDFVDLSMISKTVIELPWFGTLIAAALLISMFNYLIRKILF